MDQATILQILKNHNAPPTQENINRVMQQSGRGTELLGRSMGLQGGMDESGRGLDLMLDKHVQSTESPNRQMNYGNAVNPNSMSDGAAQNGAAPARTAPVVASPSRQANYGPGPSPSRQQGYGPGGNGTVTPTAEMPPNAGNPNVLDGSTTLGYQNETANREAANRPLGGDSGSGLEWLLAALGLGAAGGAAMRGGIPINNPPQITGPNAPAQIEGANPNQKRLAGSTPQLPDQSGPKMPSGAPVPPKQPVGGPAAPQTPDDVAKMKGEVSIANNKAKILEQMRGINSMRDLDIVRQEFGLTNEQAYELHKEARINRSYTIGDERTGKIEIGPPRPSGPPSRTPTQELVEAAAKLFRR